MELSLALGRKAARWLLCAALAATMPLCARAATYYVSASAGSDINDGLSPQTAWQTLQHIYTKCTSSAPFLPGDNILLRSGDTWDGQVLCNANGTADQPITFGAYDSGAKPVILGDNPTATWTPVLGRPGIYQAFVGQGSVISPFAFQGDLRLQAVPVARLNLGKPADLETYLGNLPPGAFGPTTVTATLFVHTFDGQPPAGLKIFRSTGVSVSGKYLVVEGLDVRRSYTGIDLGQGANIIVRSNDVQDTIGIGIYLRGGDVNCLVEGNTITMTRNTAIYVRHGADNIIRSNRIDQVLDTFMGFKLKGDQAGIGLQESNGNLVEYNTLSNVKSGAFDYYFEYGSTVRYNYAYRCGGGIFPHGTKLSVYSNIFDVSWRPGSGIGGGISAVNTGLNPILVFNNVFYGTGAYGLLASSPGSFVPPGSRTAAAQAQSGGGPVIFRNNIVVGWQPGGVLLKANAGIDSDYNCFFSAGQPKFVRLKDAYQGLAAFQSATGLELHSIFADPRFSAANPLEPADFVLLPGSPCIGGGADLKQLGIFGDDYTDYAGIPIPQGSHPNMGAFQSTGPQHTVPVASGNF